MAGPGRLRYFFALRDLRIDLDARRRPEATKGAEPRSGVSSCRLRHRRAKFTDGGREAGREFRRR